MSDKLVQIIDQYVTMVRAEMDARLKAWSYDVFNKEECEVIGGVLARQVSLVTNMARSPGVWTPHIAPILLRCLADNYINFSWIVAKPLERARKFIEYGLGQEKLCLEHYKAQVGAASQADPEIAEFIHSREQMLDAERYSFLIPVNLGSWSEMSTRKMAEEVGEKAFYDLVYGQFSSSVHSTWSHIWRLNLAPCTNPLHMGHRVAMDLDTPIDLDLFATAAKYLEKMFKKFDLEVLKLPESSAYKCFDFFFSHFGSEAPNDTSTPSEPEAPQS